MQQADEPRGGQEGRITEDGEVSALSKAYKGSPTLEHYVKLRRANPDKAIEVAVLGGADHLFSLESEITKYGFDMMLVASVMDADQDAISELSLQLMESIVQARRLSKSGGTHLARRGVVVPDKLIDWLIGVMLDSLSWNDVLLIPRDLIVLIRERLSGSNPEYEKANAVHQQRWDAILIGGQIKAAGGQATIRNIARVLEVAPSTVKRWFPRGDFQQEVETVSRWFDEQGKLRELAPLRSKDKSATKRSRTSPVTPLQRK